MVPRARRLSSGTAQDLSPPAKPHRFLFSRGENFGTPREQRGPDLSRCIMHALAARARGAMKLRRGWCAGESSPRDPRPAARQSAPARGEKDILFRHPANATRLALVFFSLSLALYTHICTHARISSLVRRHVLCMSVCLASFFFFFSPLAGSSSFFFLYFPQNATVCGVCGVHRTIFTNSFPWFAGKWSNSPTAIC